MKKWLLRGWTGLAVVALAIAVGGAAGLPASAAPEIEPELGIVITSIVQDGPVAEAGVVRGDILQQIDSEPVQEVTDLLDSLAEMAPGDEVELTVLHGDDLLNLRVTLGERNGDAYLGLAFACTMTSMTHEIFADRLDSPGVRILEVVADSPAEDAGLLQGDVIAALDGQDVASWGGLVEQLAGLEPGDSSVLTIVRADEDPAEFEVELGEHPDDPDAAYLGILGQPVLPRRRLEGFWMPFGEMHGLEEFEFEEMPFPHFEDLDLDELSDLEFTRGTVLREVVEDSPASDAGLQEGDVITAVDGEAMDSPQALSEAVSAKKPGEEIGLSVYSSKAEEEKSVEVTLGEHPDDPERAYLGVTVGGFYARGYSGEHMPRGFEFFGKPSESDEDPELRRWRLPFDFGFDFRLPFDGDGLRFGPDELRFGPDWLLSPPDELPQLFQFRGAPGGSAGGSFGESA